MSTKLTGEELQKRLQTTLKDTYTFIYSVMKGATVANAFFVLHSFFVKEEPFSWILILFWLTSFLAVIVTFLATSVGTLIANFPLDWRDSVFPFVLATFEFLSFSVLQQNTAINYWYFLFSAYMAVTAVIIYNAAIRIKTIYYHEDLHRHVADWKVSTQSDYKVACIIVLLSVLCGFLRLSPWNSKAITSVTLTIMPLLFVGMLIKGIHSQQQKLNLLYKAIKSQP
jgi:hypothetical protein